VTAEKSLVVGDGRIEIFLFFAFLSQPCFSFYFQFISVVPSDLHCIVPQSVSKLVAGETVSAPLPGLWVRGDLLSYRTVEWSGVVWRFFRTTGAWVCGLCKCH
jgi:hypothetical protein